MRADRTAVSPAAEWVPVAAASLASAPATGTVARTGNSRSVPRGSVIVAGLTMPLLLTSRIHVGRLVPALPFLLLLVALGGVIAARGVANRLESWATTRHVTGYPVLQMLIGKRVATLALLSILLLAVGWTSWSDERVPLSLPPEATTAAVLEAHAKEAQALGGAALVVSPTLGPELEAIHAAIYRLALDPTYRIIDLTARDTRPPDGATADPRPPLYAVGVLDSLRSGTLPSPCDYFYFVAPEAVDVFVTELDRTGALAECTTPVRYEVLPG